VSFCVNLTPFPPLLAQERGMKVTSKGLSSFGGSTGVSPVLTILPPSLRKGERGMVNEILSNQRP
jgi:hypothetical protein